MHFIDPCCFAQLLSTSEDAAKSPLIALEGLITVLSALYKSNLRARQHRDMAQEGIFHPIEIMGFIYINKDGIYRCNTK